MTELRAAAHVHSDWSYDGSWTLGRLAEAFAKRGYGAVLTAEHDRGWNSERWERYKEACARASTASLVIVPGIEYADASDTVHVPVWGAPFLTPGLPTVELLVLAREHGAFALLAHPARRDAWRLFEPAWAESLSGIEVWNRKYDGWAPSPTALELTCSYPGLVQMVGLDFHTHRQFFPLSLDLRLSDKANVGAVLEALRTRRFSSVVGRFEVKAFSNGAARRGAAGAEWARRRAATTLRKLRNA